MLIILFIIFLLMIGISFILLKNFDEAWSYLLGTGGVLFGCIAEVVVVIAIIMCSDAVLNLKVVDSKIEMYEQENIKIEKDVSDIIKNYMQYETDLNKFTIENIDTSNLLFLTELYPELKSNALVNKQIDIYVENNNKIKELKEQKFNNMSCKWWLYFGKISEEIK